MRQKTEAHPCGRDTQESTQGWVSVPRGFPATPNDASRAPVSKQCQASDPVSTLWAQIATLWGGTELGCPAVT